MHAGDLYQNLLVSVTPADRMDTCTDWHTIIKNGLTSWFYERGSREINAKDIDYEI